MGTLGLHWKLPSKIKALRYKRFMKSWRKKDRSRSKETKMKLSEARRKQGLECRAPESSQRIRNKISKATKEMRKTIPPHNAGITGYKNRGSFPVGNVPENKGKKMKPSVRRKLEKVWLANALAAPKIIKEHHAAVLRIAKQLRKNGQQVWTCLDRIPDLIIKIGNQLIAIEVTRSKYISPKRRNKHSGSIFDVVRWVNLRGRSI